jgi:hypothetical protein
VVRDPEAQTGLYYHPTSIHVSHGEGQPQETVEGWALSFLPEETHTDQAAIAYLLPPKAGKVTDADPATYVRAHPDRVRMNADAWAVVHDVLKNEIVPHDDLLQFEAQTRHSGWAHLTDLRQPLMPGRIANPENILASVAFVDGQLDPNTYEVNHSYRLVTGYDGPIQLAESWIQKLRQRFHSL